MLQRLISTNQFGAVANQFWGFMALQSDCIAILLKRSYAKQLLVN